MKKHIQHPLLLGSLVSTLSAIACTNTAEAQAPLQLVAGSTLPGVVTSTPDVSGSLTLSLPSTDQFQAKLDANMSDRAASQISASILCASSQTAFNFVPSSNGYLTITATDLNAGAPCGFIAGEYYDLQATQSPDGSSAQLNMRVKKNSIYYFVSRCGPNIPVDNPNGTQHFAGYNDPKRPAFKLSFEMHADKEPDTLDSALLMLPSMATPSLYSGSIESVTDADVFCVIPTQSAKLIVELAPANNSKLNCDLEVRGKGVKLAQEGNLVNNYSPAGGPGDRYLALDVEAGNKYYIVVSGSQNTTGAYNLSCGYASRADGIGNAKDTALPINYIYSIGEKNTGLDGFTKKPIEASRSSRPSLIPALNNSLDGWWYQQLGGTGHSLAGLDKLSLDSDWYYFWGNGEQVDISTYYEWNDGKNAPSIRLVDETGKTLVDGVCKTASRPSGPMTKIQYQLPKGSKRYYIRVYSSAPTTIGARKYVLDVDLASKKDDFKHWVFSPN